MENFSTISGSSKAVMIYFYSPGCSTCKSLRPKVKNMLTQKFPEILLYEIDSSEHPLLTAEASVFSAPTILAFFEGKEYLRESKYISIDQFADKLSRYYDMLFD